MRRILALLLVSSIPALLSGCGGTRTTEPEDSFQKMVDEINAQHPPLYDGTNTVYPPSD